MRMVEEGEEFPSPMRWLRRIKAVQGEQEARDKVRETAERLRRLQLPGPKAKRDRRAARPRKEGETDEERRLYLKAFVGEPGEEQALPGDCLEYMGLCAASMGLRAPSYPGMGLNQILAVR